ncbi:MAG: AMP-binding protein, partial [Pseudomonadota bacterium]
GGTTGSPKLALHTHGNQVFTAWASVQLQGIRAADKVINGYPLFHVAGVLPGSLASLSAGVETLIPTTQLFRNRDIIRHYWRLVERYQTTVVSAVPTVLAAIAAVPLEGADITSINFCRTGAAILPPELQERFKTLFGLQIKESLGMTEMAGISTITPRGVQAPAGCVGFPLPYCRYKIVAIDDTGAPTERELPTGEVGMALVKSPNVFPGYLNQGATSSAFTQDGWLISGDLAFLDAEGRLNLAGRAKDLIIRSGHNIDPQMIENALDTHPSVDLCAAVGAPDAIAGELPVAFVTLKPGCAASEEELMRFAAKTVDEPPARPKSITVLDTMPQTNVGKIFKPELRRLAAIATVQNRIIKMLQTFGATAAATVSAHSGPRGTIVVHVSVKLDSEKIGTLRSEINKLPIEVCVENAPVDPI